MGRDSSAFFISCFLIARSTVSRALLQCTDHSHCFSTSSSLFKSSGLAICSFMPVFFASCTSSAKQYLNDHCIQDIPLEQIVRISCMSARKLQTAFKEYHGCTITEYIQQRRMSQAETLLAKTDLSIGQVAQSVGYTSASRFAELFRKSTGLLPLEYRKVSQRK